MVQGEQKKVFEMKSRRAALKISGINRKTSRIYDNVIILDFGEALPRLKILGVIREILDLKYLKVLAGRATCHPFRHSFPMRLLESSHGIVNVRRAKRQNLQGQNNPLCRGSWIWNNC